jgi:hypothetical protein
MRTNECYTTLKDAIIYNAHYAPAYPAEDRTNLSKEHLHIQGRLRALKQSVHSAHKLNQLRLAGDEIDRAFVAYQAGEDGRKHLEEALVYIDRSRRTAPPPVDYVAGPGGTVKVDGHSVEPSARSEDSEQPN